MLSDFRLALRSLARTPGFTLVAVLIIAAGIGATTTVFSWVERVLLNPLPGVAAPGRIVALETLAPSGAMIDSSYPDFRDYQDQAGTLSAVLVFKERPLSLGSGERLERVWAEMVSGNFFTALGVRPRLGRFFAPEDRADTPASSPVVVISESLWRNRFGADPKILGRTLRLNQHDLTVIGVAPAEFPGSLNGLAFDVWVPLRLQGRLTGADNWLDSRSSRSLHMQARLAPGVTLEAARTELAGLAQRIAAGNPKTNRGIGIAVLPVVRSPHGAQHELALPLLILLGVSGLVLLIVCANLSNLLFVRATARQHEICIRQALGAGWFRLARQLLAESLLLSAVGAGLGLVLTLWLADFLRFFIPDTTLPIALGGQLDARVLAGAVGLALVTTLAAGLAPALWAARSDLIGALRGGGRGAGLTRRAENLRGALVVLEVATALVTLACAGLAAKSFHEVKMARPGFEPEGVLLAGLQLETGGYNREEGGLLLDRLRERLAVLPGVQTVAIAEDVPLGLDGGSWEDLAVPGYVPAPNENMKIYRNLVSPAYFSLMRIPVASGREFSAADQAQSPPVAVINETFARRYFGGANPLGRTFSMWGGRRVLTVVGVVQDIKYHSLGESALPYFYVPLRQFFSPGTGVAVHVRTTGDPLALLPALRHELHALDPAIPIFDALTLGEYINAARFAQKAAATLLGLLSAVAVTLAALGLYGVLAFAVAQRVPEIGLRLALGAQSSDIVRLVLRRGFGLVLGGLAAGLLAATGVGRLLAGLLYGVRTSEPTLLAAAAGLLLLAALLACWLPARRATKVDPMVALRAE